MPVIEMPYIQTQIDKSGSVNNQSQKPGKQKLNQAVTAAVQATESSGRILPPVNCNTRSNWLRRWTAHFIKFTGKDESSFRSYDSHYPEQQHIGKKLYLESENLLQNIKDESTVKQPGVKLKGWLGWLLGTVTLIGTSATGAYFYARETGGTKDTGWQNTPGSLSLRAAPVPSLNTNNTANRVRAEKLVMDVSTTTPSKTGFTEGYNSEALLDIERLKHYDRLKYDVRIPTSLRYLEQSGQLTREFYNRYFYPLLEYAAANLNSKAIPLNSKNLMAELAGVILSAITRLREINIAHALRIDPLYNKLIYLNREIRIQEKISILTQGRTQMVKAKWLSEKLRTALSLSELDELQQEALTLIKYYSRATDLRVSYHYSHKLREITQTIYYSLYQMIKRLSYNGIDKYLTDYFSVWLLNLDKEVCKDTRIDKPKSDKCQLFADIGVSLFRNKIYTYIKPASLLIAYKIFIPRLKQIINSSHLQINGDEHRLIEVLLCGISSQKDVYYCSENYLANLPVTEKDINRESEKDTLATRQIEDYVAKPVPFDGEIINTFLGASAGIGAAAGGIAGSAGLSVSINKLEKAIDALENLHIEGSSNINSEHLTNFDSRGSLASSNSDSSLDLDSFAKNSKRDRDLERFPDIPFPQLERRDQMMVWNTRAREELQGKDYIVTKGITADISGEVPEYITQAQIRLQAGFSEVEEMVKNLRENLRIKLDGKKPDNDYQNYLREFFSKAVNTEDPKIIGMCISRFREAVNAVDEFFKKTREQHYSNIFIISTRQQESAVKGQFTSLLSTEELDSVPVAMTSRSSNPTIAVVYDHSVVNDPMHEAYSRQGLNYAIPDTLGHEATHAALDARDYFYLPRTAEGRAISPKEAYQKIRASLEEMKIQRDLKEAIKEFTAQRKLINPFGSDSSLSSGGSVDAGEIMKLLEQYPAFRSYLIMNNAEHLLIYMQYISRGAPFDAAPLQ